MEIVSSNYLVRSHHPTPTGIPSRLKSFSGPMPSQGHQSSSTAHFSTSSQPSSLRSSDSTQATSSSTLFNTPPPMPPANGANGAPMLATNSVLNTRADKETSLFQVCLNLRHRLRGIPECNEALVQEEEDAEACNEDVDPVTLVWRTLRQGFPLLSIYNAINPAEPLKVSDQKKTKRDQQAAMIFITACMKRFGLRPEELFTIMDLYGDDTTGFVKVTRVVNRVLDILVAEGYLQDVNDEPAPSDSSVSAVKGKTQRQHIIDELVRTERTYVHHLELLQAFKKLVEERQTIPGDTIHDIFLNLNALLDFQRRFLIRVEQTNATPEDQQNWGAMFTLYREAFNVYEPYVANIKRCEEIALREYEKLKAIPDAPQHLMQMVESPTVLSSFLLKPFQRLAKYPLLLKELRDKGDLSEDKKAEITAGIEAASAVLERTNEAVHLEERHAAVAELRERVEDWKGHRPDSFGELLLYGTYHVIKGGASGNKDEEREYKIFLFQMILLCCKEMNPSKSKNKAKNPVDKKGRTRLQLKGRIFMQNVTDTVCQSKPGFYTCQIFWRGDPGIEYFTIKFPAEEIMKKWAHQVDSQRRIWQEMQRSSSTSRAANVSDTQYEWLRDQGALTQNPYAEDDDDDDTDTSTVQSAHQSEYSLTRNDSNTSLPMRSRTNTLESGPPLGALGRAPPRQFPMGAQAPQLQVRTQNAAGGQQMSTTSPSEHIMDSYFSPTSESPVSTRSSGQLSMQTSMFPFPRQVLPNMPNGWNNEEHARFTAPAMPRQSSRDGPLNGYQSRNAMQRPSLPPNPSSAQMAQARLRSASSPDIQNAIGPRRIADPQQPGVPELPPFPAHYAYQPGILNRNNNGSPQSMMSTPQNMPMRAATHSPNVQQQRDRIPPPRSVPLQVQEAYPAQYPPPLPRSMTQVDRTMTPDMRAVTPGSIDARVMTQSPPAPSADVLSPTQLKIKVHCPSAGSSMTLVVPTNISYQSLKDRIDAKLQRSTSLSLGSGQVKLKYLDDDDYVSIQSDEDVQMAFETWKEQQRDQVMGQMGEVDLYVQ